MIQSMGIHEAMSVLGDVLLGNAGVLLAVHLNLERH